MFTCAHCDDQHQFADEGYACALVHSAVRPGDPYFRTRYPETDKQWPGPAPVSQPGLYKLGETIYRVVESQQNRLYAKCLNVRQNYLGVPTGCWEYAPGMIRQLRAADKLSKEDAARFGQETGVCCRCGATLTNDESKAAGIGPICAGRW